MFQNSTDVGLHLSLDRVQLTALRNHEVTPILLFNQNLPPTLRYKVKNIMVFGIIPGPSSPGDIDSFLAPLIDELILLDN